ncbi:MAG: heavy-metal-associated domain-containing protein [Crocinitomicaceae bacterium]|nr:heavy-metal-associated domain-containing protein [Crocinitomicaceae bacterium]
MRALFFTLMLTMAWLPATLSAETRYEIRVDGLACPYCAYGIEKKFMQREIVKTFDIDFEKGLVKVTFKDGEDMTEPQLKHLFREAGFSYRSVTKKTL